MRNRSSAGTPGLSGGEAAGAPRPARPVVLAVVARPHGLKGELVIRRFNPGSTALAVGERVWLEGRGAPGRWARVESTGGDRLGLEGVRDRAQAELLRGAELSVDRSSLPDVESGEFYLHDLIGFQVLDAAGGIVGRLEGLQASGTREYFVIKGAGDVWLPADAPIVAAVDLEAATVRLNIEIDSEKEP